VTGIAVQARSARVGDDTLTPFRRTPLRLVVIFLLLVFASVAWRKGSYFSGGTDSVVLAKAALTCLAFGLALTTPRAPDAWSRYRAAPLVLLVLYLGVATVGGLLHGNGFPSLVLAIRLGVLALTLLLVVLSYPWETVMSAAATAMLAVAGVGAVTGLGSVAATGRLYGGVPPLNANEICLLVSVPVVLLFWKCVHRPRHWLEYATLLPLFGVVWLTGARTGLAALVVALMVVVLLAPRVPGLVVGLLALALPAMIYLTFFTPVVSDYTSRGDDLTSVTTLNSRTVAWSAALDYPESALQRTFGAGLSVKEIPVSAMYRTQQIFDSSWISAFVQSGYLGAAILALLALVTLAKAFATPQPQRGAVVALVVMVTMVSLLESGLFDTSSAFITFFLLSLYAHRVRGSREST
jgi:hypothetical protein